MTIEQHKEYHVKLHRALDELVADYLTHTGGYVGSTTILQLMQWSCEQTRNPSLETFMESQPQGAMHEAAEQVKTAYDAGLINDAKARKSLARLKEYRAFEHALEIHLCEEPVHGVFKKCGRFAKFVARTANGPVYVCEHHSHNFPVQIVKAIIKEAILQEKVKFPEGAIPLGNSGWSGVPHDVVEKQEPVVWGSK